ncbi:MAG: AMP nucleosidase, partial [Roseicyclus sp.]
MTAHLKHLRIESPDAPDERRFTDASEAVDCLIELYEAATGFLRARFSEVVLSGEAPPVRFRAYYPEIRITTTTYGQVDTRLAFGHVAEPGTYSTTVTRPDLFRHYLTQQIGLLIQNHGVPVHVGLSTTPIPVHFAVLNDAEVQVPQEGAMTFPLRDAFDVPDLQSTHDDIVNGFGFTHEDGSGALAPFTAQRIDYSLARLAHYTATLPEHFQNFVLFTNYQFYMDEFVGFARKVLADPESGYRALVGPGNDVITAPDQPLSPPSKLPQMPTYHLTRDGSAGITLVNIGVGPSNAKTATDHIAVLRPHAWLMVGHCAGFRNTQSLGDYVLAHAYLREDRVLDDDLPVWVPIPALAEVQIALEEAVSDVAEVSGYDLKRIMRTGTVASVDNRNW